MRSTARWVAERNARQSVLQREKWTRVKAMRRNAAAKVKGPKDGRTADNGAGHQQNCDWGVPMNRRWIFETESGTFSIEQRDNRFHPIYDDESLGSYDSPQAALDDLVGGHTYGLSNGLDSSEVGLPDDLSEWTLIRI
jgi:hypothetical protein